MTGMKFMACVHIYSSRAEIPKFPISYNRSFNFMILYIPSIHTETPPAFKFFLHYASAIYDELNELLEPGSNVFTA